MPPLLLALAGCSAEAPSPPASIEGTSVAASGVACAPPSPLPAPPPDVPLALPPGAVLTDTTLLGGQRLVSGRVEDSVAAVLGHFRAAPGYVVQRDEDEGRSGELVLFGATGDVSVTVARLTCPQGSTGFTIAVAEPAPGT